MEITRTTPTDWVDADASDEAQAQADGYSLYPTRPMMVPTDSAALHAWLDQAEAPRHPARSHTLSCLAAGRCPAGEPC